MKIFSLNNYRYPLAIAAMATSLNHATQVNTRPLIQPITADDTFIKQPPAQNPVDKYTTEDLPKVFREEVNPSGWTNNKEVLKKAPVPKFQLMGEEKLASAVVDVTNCILYYYDMQGRPLCAFPVATGASSTPTSQGVKRVVAKLIYPYSTSPARSKRRRHPYDYGPKILYLYKVNTETGEEIDDGGYIHGTRRENAVEKGHITHGCVRLHNRDALYFINDLMQKDMYIVFKK